jgi:hypothetical protein
MSWGWLAVDVAACVTAFAWTGWREVNLRGWKMLNDEVGDEWAPRSWRIYLGPRRYTRWALRRHGFDVLNPVEGWED